MKHYIKTKNLNLKMSKNPHMYYSDSIIIYDGKVFKGEQIKPNSNNAKETENAVWLSKTFNIDVYIMPEIRQNGIKTYDYLLDSSKEAWDLKATITGNSRRLVKNNIDQKQATSYIFDFSKTSLSIAEIEERIDYAFATVSYLKTIILKENNAFIGIYKRKK